MKNVATKRLWNPTLAGDDLEAERQLVRRLFADDELPEDDEQEDVEEGLFR